MELIQQSRCRTCGGTLSKISDRQWKCDFCKNIYDEVTVKKHVEELRDLLDGEKREKLSNLRRNLYNAVNAQYISSQEIKNICFSIKEMIPDDFQANFYHMACISNGRTIAKSIRNIEVTDNLDMVEQMIKFLIKSIQEDILTDLIDLIERAFKSHNMLGKYEQYATWYSQEAEKVKQGMYETKLPRDVFVAYSSKDMKKVLELVEMLESSGISCFVASRNLRHGKGAIENYNKALSEAMDSCSSFVFVSSMNSRNLGCDAVRIEIPYIKNKDIANAPSEFKNKYTTMPTRYKKPRVEFRLEESDGVNIADRLTNEFFDGYERVYSAEEVAFRVSEQLLGVPMEEEVILKSEHVHGKTKICVSCGAEVPEESKFCHKCGKDDFVSNIAELIEYNNMKMEEERLARTKAEANARTRYEQAEKEHLEYEKAFSNGGIVKPAEKSINAPKCQKCGGTRIELIFDGHYRCDSCGWTCVQKDNGLFLDDPSPLEAKSIFNKAYAYDYGKGVIQNYNEAFRLYSIAANMGYNPAQCNLGVCYKKGHGVAKDLSEAIRWYRKSAEQGNMYAQENLGVCYKNGTGVGQDYYEAVRWFRKAADQGYADAQCSLGICYENGEGVTKDMAEAARWYRKAAEQGNMYAQKNLGVCYKNGTGVGQDYYEAVRWLRKSADQGCADAQNWLGVCYKNGQGVAKDLSEAIRWYRKAAEQGDMYAQNNLGNCYYYGWGIQIDYAEAAKWLRKSADQGNADSQNHLGVCYKNGQGVAKDLSVAIRWYRKSADQGNMYAQYNLGVCYKNGTGVSQDYYEAVRWLRKAADQGYADSQNSLGLCYENGQGVTKDMAEAARWYRKAADQGNMYAQHNLGRCYENGWGVYQSRSEAIELYRKAAEQGLENSKKALERLGYN